MRTLIALLLCSVCFGGLRSDINGDCRVDFEDLALLVEDWGLEDPNCMSYYYLDFDGGGYCSVTSDAALVPEDGDFSVCFWAIISDATSEVLLDTTKATANGYRVTASSWHEGLRVLLGDGVNSSWITGPSPTGEWQHITITLDRDGNACIYSNASLCTTEGITEISGTINSGGQTLYIGGSGAIIGSPVPSFTGAMDDIRLYKRLLTSHEVEEIYNNGEGSRAYGRDIWNGWYTRCDNGSGSTVTGYAVVNGAETELSGTINDTDHVTWVEGGKGQSLWNPKHSRTTSWTQQSSPSTTWSRQSRNSATWTEQ